MISEWEDQQCNATRLLQWSYLILATYSLTATKQQVQWCQASAKPSSGISLAKFLHAFYNKER